MMRKLLGLAGFLLVVLIITGTAAVTHAQGTQQSSFDIVLADAPEGFSGGIVRVEIMPGVTGKFGDINCNGNIDFDDVVQIFLPLAMFGVPVDCRTEGQIYTVNGVTFPDFGLNEITEEGADYIQFAVVDLNQLIQPGATDSLIATVNLTSTAGGIAGYYVEWLTYDDDTGDPREQSVVKGVLR